MRIAGPCEMFRVLRPGGRLVAALARAGVRAGIGLSLSGGEIVFFHRWHMIRARKPAR
jgi:hypothetical protein